MANGDSVACAGVVDAGRGGEAEVDTPTLDWPAWGLVDGLPAGQMPDRALPSHLQGRRHSPGHAAVSTRSAARRRGLRRTLQPRARLHSALGYIAPLDCMAGRH